MVKLLLDQNISFIGMLGMYQINPRLDHWKAPKKVLRYLKRTNSHMLTYKILIILSYLDIQIQILPDVLIQENPCLATCTFLFEGQFKEELKQSGVTASTMQAKFVAYLGKYL